MEPPENNLSLNIDSDKYKLILYIELTKLVFKLVPENNDPDKIFQNKFELQELKNLHRSFKGFESLEDIKDTFIEEFSENQFRGEKKGEDVFIYLKKGAKEIPFFLKKVTNEIDTAYNKLSEEMKKIIDNNELVIGIDLGTTYSCASIMLDEHIIMIENSLGLRTTPSYVWFLEPDKIYVGELAKLQPSFECKNIIFSTKRFLGKNINDKEIKEIIPDLPFNLKQDNELNQLKISINFNHLENKQKEYYPEQISSLILKKLVKDSEYYLSKILQKKIQIKNAVITTPAYFNQKQREATYQAAEIIGLKVQRMINEPTAASLAYGYKSLENKTKLITVLDFGGGTLDLTLLKFIKNEKGIYCDIQFSYGNTHFGGEDFDNILMGKCLEKIGTKKENINTKLQCNVRLKRACELAKIKLSKVDKTSISLEEYDQNTNINLPLTKKDFESYCKPLFKKFETILEDFLSSCGYKREDIAEVILIGGTTFIPKVEEIIKKVFKFSKIMKNLNQTEAVAKGAAIQAAMMSDLPSVRNISLLDVTNLSLGVNTLGDEMSVLIKRSTPIPEKLSQIYQTVKDNQKEVLVEIFEGEDKSTKNNLCLDKFIIKNLKEMKRGEAKIEIQISVNNNSLLEVTAKDMQNEDNVEKLEIKRPKGLRDLINVLKNETDKIELIDIKEYDDIKDSILELEENIVKTNKEEEIQKLNAEIINNLAEFLKKAIKKNRKERLIISYIKYYFMKVMTYLEFNDKEKIIANFFIIFNLVLEEIEFNSTELLFEIMELFVFNKDIYIQCIEKLLEYFFTKISKTFYQVNSNIEKEPYKYQAHLEELDKLKDMTVFVQRFLIFYDNLSEKKFNNNLMSSKDSINELFIKIEVKKLIIKNRLKKLDLSIKEEKSNLETLILIYGKCKSNDAKDLIELESILKESNNNISKEEKIAINFIDNFNKMHDDDMNKFLYIFEKYDLAGIPDSELILKLGNFDERETLLTELCAKFKNYHDKLFKGKKQEAINLIHVYLNHLKKKCSDDIHKNIPLFVNLQL